MRDEQIALLENLIKWQNAWSVQLNWDEIFDEAIRTYPDDIPVVMAAYLIAQD